MSHNIEMIDGIAQMAYAGEVPWHGLGIEVPADVSATQMMVAAGLDWDVEKVDAYIEWNGSRTYTGQQALVRATDGKILTNVGPNWEPCQNAEAFEFFHDFVEEGDMEMHTAGSLREGQIVWALAKVKESFELFKGDRVDSYLLFSNPHQYGKSIDVMFTPIRVVCNNTLSFALETKGRNANSVAWNHRTKFDAEKVKEALGIAHLKMDTYKETASFLGSKKATKEKVLDYFKEVFPVTSSKSEKELSRNARIALDILETQPGHDFAAGTWWQPFNAVTFMVDHVVGNNDENRLNSAWFGGGRSRKTEALKKAVEYAEAA